MNIYVILKQTFDTEEKVVIQDGDISEDSVKFIINPYDEYAVEEALRLKEQHGGKVIVISVGPNRTAEALKTALAMGADEAVLISDNQISVDEFSISKILAAYLDKQSYDLILGGNFSIDNGGGQVAIRLSQLLNVPHVASITKIDVNEDDHAVVQRDSEGDIETLIVTLPALFTAQQGLNEPRYPTLPGIMKAKKKPFHQLTLDDLGLSTTEIRAKTERHSLFLPPKRKAGQILQGELTEQASKLVHLLQDADGMII